MSIEKNLEIIRNYGDLVQFEYGAEFGHYSQHVNSEQFRFLCDNINANPWIASYGYFAQYEINRNGDGFVTIRNKTKKQLFSVQFMDFTVYFNLTNAEWQTISPRLYTIVQKEWQKLLSSINPEYNERLNLIEVLSGHKLSSDGTESLICSY